MKEYAPVYLLADSQPLFINRDGASLISRIKEHISKDRVKAAYIGASNGDEPVYYDIFCAAMSNVGINDVRMISALFEPEDKVFLSEADIVLLAGGDVELGWKTFRAVGLENALRERYQSGATFIGVSAGAVQLGSCAFNSSTIEKEILDTFQFLPLCIGVHEEECDWTNLKELISHQKSWVCGLGIPAGGALIYYPDRSYESVYQPIHELIYVEGEEKFKEGLIISST